MLPIPEWLLALKSASDTLTENGLTGLIDAAPTTSVLGERLRSGDISVEALQQFIASEDEAGYHMRDAWKTLLSEERGPVTINVTSHPYRWRTAGDAPKQLGREGSSDMVEVPPYPRLPDATHATLKHLGYVTVCIPASWNRVSWQTEPYLSDLSDRMCGEHWTRTLRAVAGCWIAFETIPFPERDRILNQPGNTGWEGEYHDPDPIAMALNIPTRFGLTHETVSGPLCTKLGELIGLPDRVVLPFTADYANINRLRRLQMQKNGRSDLPDLDRYRSQALEWTRPAEITSNDGKRYLQRMAPNEATTGSCFGVGVGDLRCVGFRTMILLSDPKAY